LTSVCKWLQNAEIEGIMVPFLHINHLIELKKRQIHPKDQIDVIYREKIKQPLENESHP
jgi:hypothetical protein